MTIFKTVLILFIIYGGLNLSGFCFAHMRWLTDGEKIEAIFNYYNNHRFMPIKGANHVTKNYKLVPYKNFQEFVEENHDCCHVNPPGRFYDLPPPPFWDRVFGYHSGDVIVLNYTVRYVDENGNQQSQKMEVEHVLQNCGAIKW